MRCGTAGKTLAIVLIGVSGSGKTTVGKQLAASLNATFLEGDDYHSSANIAKMRSGTPLSDPDRWPWLAKLAGAVGDHIREGRAVVVSCSALKRAYRQRLMKDARVPLAFVHLTIDPAHLEHRMRARHQHFMPEALLESQLATLEPLEADEPGTTVAETGTVQQTVAAIHRWLKHPTHGGRHSHPHPFTLKA